MRIHVKYFASIREAIGLPGEHIDTDAATLGVLRVELAGRGAGYATSLAPGRAVRIALDQAMAEESNALVAGCEVAFFPPVTGG
jgi:molybdopterin synthase sulfur carrier subunit